MKVCIDIDDFHSFPKWDCTDVLLRCVEQIPEIKFTLFFTPFMKKIPATDYPQSLERLRELIETGNVEVYLHGLTHMKFLNGEFGALPMNIVRKRILKSFQYTERCRIPFKRGYKFPWNVYNSASLKALERLDLVLFSNKYEKEFHGRQVIWENRDHIKKRYIQPANYRHGRPVKPLSTDTIYYHGHAQNVRSTGIRESCNTLLKELSELKNMTDVDFIFCSDLAEKYCSMRRK
ncbi:MAG: hypothetical protein AMS17_16420 [Spirochaetes bacterium DG_61]|nr:MAG: hypothetical protein AMS17_16420 [Spirochaetes bacterium DG_61]